MSAINRRALIRKSIITLLLTALAVSTASSWLHDRVLQPAMQPLDTKAESYIEDTMTRAAYTFAAARAINALISMIQGTAIAVSPAGVGVTLSIGEVLDPINDLIERFSWIMLVSTTSLGLQRVLMEVGNWLAIQWLLTAALLCLALSLWFRPRVMFDTRRMAERLLILALLVRFFIPGYAIISEDIYQRFLAARYEEATQSLDSLRQDLKATATVVAQDSNANGSEGYLDNMRQFLQETREFMDIRQQIDRLKAKLTHLTEYTVTLIVVFSLQTLLLPLFLMWLATRFIRQAPRLVWPVPIQGKTASPKAAPDADPTNDDRPKPPEINS